jgi:hypothetical protein
LCIWGAEVFVKAVCLWTLCWLGAASDHLYGIFESDVLLRACEGLSEVRAHRESSAESEGGLSRELGAQGLTAEGVYGICCNWIGGSLEEDLQDLLFDITRLEQYTEKVKNEVLRVHAVVDGEEDRVIIFKGFSSSLMRPTAYDPAEPVLPPSATILAIDRIRGPFNPAKVLLIKGGRGLSWQQFQTLLEEKGV